MLDFIRIACAVPPVRVGDTRKNAEEICRMLASADEQQADLLVLPELSLTGYTCQDLFFQDALYRGMLEGLSEIVKASAVHRLLVQECRTKKLIPIGLPEIPVWLGMSSATTVLTIHCKSVND